MIVETREEKDNREFIDALMDIITSDLDVLTYNVGEKNILITMDKDDQLLDYEVPRDDLTFNMDTIDEDVKYIEDTIEADL